MLQQLQQVAPWSLVVIPVLFNLWGLGAETMPVQHPNDGALHLALVQWAQQQINHGNLPVDGWFPNLSTGAAEFRHYQWLPHLIAAFLAMPFGAPTVYAWTTYLLLAFWPVSVYLGARLLGWDAWVAGAAALMSPLLMSASGYGFEPSSYLWRGYGLWPQLWAMCLLPLAWGLGWRAISSGRNYASSALVTALTVACHFIVGYIAFLGLGVFAVSSLRDGTRRLLRAAAISIGAILIAGRVIAPLLSDLGWLAKDEFTKGTFYENSFGARQVLSWLFTGQLYDAGRFPIVSLLVGAGLIACGKGFGRDPRARAIVGIWLASLMLFFGPPSLGPLARIPTLDLVPLHRMIAGVHIAGLVLAGIGAGWLARQVLTWGAAFLQEVRPIVQAGTVVAMGILLLSPAWKQVGQYFQGDASLIRAQHLADISDGAELAELVDILRRLPPGRVYAGGRTTSVGDYRIGNVPVYAVLTSYQVDLVGYNGGVVSMMGHAEAMFDNHNPAQYDLFNIRYLVLPDGVQPPVKATLLAMSGRHTLWQVGTSGYLEAVDTNGPPIIATRDDLGSRGASVLESQDLASNHFRWVDYLGELPPDPTLLDPRSSPDPPGSVQLEQPDLIDGNISAAVTIKRAAVLLFKASFDQHWKANVDGVDVPAYILAPAMEGIPIRPGQHQVSFHYQAYPYTMPLFLLGAATLLALWLGPRLWARISVSGNLRIYRSSTPS